MPTCTMLVIPTLAFPASGGCSRQPDLNACPASRMAPRHGHDRGRSVPPQTARARAAPGSAAGQRRTMMPPRAAVMAGQAATPRWPRRPRPPAAEAHQKGAVMLTLPVQAGRAAADRPARILVIGRSESVLSEAVRILREKGHAAGATNEFGRTLDLFDAGQLDLVVFGGMVPPDAKEHLREQMSAQNPAVAFVQGYAGIPGLIAA